MRALLLVMAGGAIGSAGRYALSSWALARFGPGFPWGTLIANVLGGAAMGVLAGSLLRGGSEPVRLLLGIGLLGGFTTFSAFSLESWTMIERGDWGAALAYMLGSLTLSIAALAAGLAATRALT